MPEGRFLSREQFPVAWLRDEWEPAGKWGMRDGWSRNWTWLSDIREAYLATVGQISAGDASWSEKYASHLAHLAGIYLSSGRRWLVATVKPATTTTTSPSTSRGMGPGDAALWLMAHGCSPGSPEPGVVDLRQCGQCLQWRLDIIHVELTRHQRIDLCSDCRKYNHAN